MNISHRSKTFLRLTAMLALLGTRVALADNWPQWRGPEGTGVCAEKNLPTTWSTNQNIRWKTPLSEPGISTPIIWGHRVFVTQAVGKRRTLVCFDRANGKMLWQSGVTYAEKELTRASVAVSDGELFIRTYKHLWCIREKRPRA